MANDILLDSDNDLVIRNGDLVMGLCDSQNLDVLMVTNKGLLKQAPMLGPNLLNTTNARFDVVVTEGEILKALTDDGWKNPDVSFNAQDIYVMADRPE